MSTGPEIGAHMYVTNILSDVELDSLGIYDQEQLCLGALRNMSVIHVLTLLLRYGRIWGACIGCQGLVT